MAKHGVVKGVVSRGGEDQGIYSGAPLQPSARGEPRSPDGASLAAAASSTSTCRLCLPAIRSTGDASTRRSRAHLITNKHARRVSHRCTLLHPSEWRLFCFCFCDSIAAARALTVSRGAARVTNMEILFPTCNYRCTLS